MRSQPSLFYFELMAENEDYEDAATGQHFDTDAARNGLAVALVTLNYPLESSSQPVSREDAIVSTHKSIYLVICPAHLTRIPSYIQFYRKNIVANAEDAR